MKLIFMPLAVILMMSSCSNETNDIPRSTIYEVREIGTLSTTEYTIGKIVKLSDPPKEWYKYGDRKLLMRCRAKIKAGIDLRKLKDDDIKVSGRTIEITLPAPEIISFSMDPREMETEMESITGFRDHFSQKEKNSFMRQGENAIRKEIEETSILKDAQNNAELYVKNLYKQMGFDEVVVKHKNKTYAG